jgi:mycofactocin system glycosyltransferase
VVEPAPVTTPDAVGSGAPVPAGTQLRADPSLEWVDGAVLAGGSPWRLVRLTDRGARLVEAWCDGEPVPAEPAATALARRLLDAGLLHPVRAPRTVAAATLDVVVPVRDGADALDEVLRALVGVTTGRVLVVDDGSVDAAAVARVAAAHGAALVRRDVPGGPGAARNAGIHATVAPFVAFVDSDVRPGPGFLEGLVAHFDDPAVGAVAPRIVGPSGRGARERFEASASPLDLGRRAGAVHPGTAIPYVPAAALVVRRTALADGFDATLRTGEDVDFVWRLVDRGWRVRYEPSVVVTHAARPTWRTWFAQRYAYGLSAAPLEARHGDAAAPLRADPRVLATLALVLAGRPRAAATLLGWSAASLARQLDGVVPRASSDATARRLAARGTALAAPGLARAAFRSYGPLLVAAAVAVSPARRPVVAVAAAATAVRWWRAGRPTPRVAFAALSVADDLAYGTGVLVGAARARSLGALRPRLRPAVRAPAVSAR